VKNGKKKTKVATEGGDTRFPFLEGTNGCKFWRGNQGGCSSWTENRGGHKVAAHGKDIAEVVFHGKDIMEVAVHERNKRLQFMERTQDPC